MLEMVLSLVIGAALLVLGGEMLVLGSAAIARRFGLSTAVIGATVMGFGTSTPEFLASVQAAMLGSAPIAIGNVVGSNIANILLILGVAAMVSPIVADRSGVRRDVIWMTGASVLLVGWLLTGGLGRLGGTFFVALLIGYTVQALRVGQREGAETRPAASPAAGPASLGRAAVFVVLGLAAALGGAWAFVGGAVDLARLSGISEAVIGVTVVAIGTSLPEIAASVMAARRGESALALGNVLGSNVFNLLGVLGATALVSPLVTPPEILARDAWAMLAATALLAAVLVGAGRISRALAACFLALYAGYLALML